MIPQTSLQVKQFFKENNRFKTIQCQTIKDEWVFRSGNHVAEYPERFKRIQINATNLTQALAFDVDHEDPLIFSDYGLPAPTIITINKDNGKSHILYYLKAPVSVGKAREYMIDLYDGITTAINADTNYTGRIAKNYMNEKAFIVYGSLKSYELADFGDFTKKHTKASAEAKKSKISYFSRNCALFDTVRFYAYKTKKDFAEYDDFYDCVHKKAISENQTAFDEPLPLKEVKDTAKSIAMWTWNKSPELEPGKWNWDGYEKKPKEEVSASRANENRKRLKARLSRRLEELKTDKIPISCKFFDKAIKPHKNLSPNYYQDNYPARD